MTICLKNICVHSCEMNGYSNGFCMNPTSCYCFKMVWNITMTNCFDALCQHECEKHEYMGGTCIDLGPCHCYGTLVKTTFSEHESTTETSTTVRMKSKTTPTLPTPRSCFDDCKDNCSKKGLKKGFCEGESCHCYDPESWMPHDTTKGPRELLSDKTTGNMRFRNAITIPTTNIPQEYLDMHLGDKVCTRMVCRMLCSEKRLSKGFCIGGNMCHCFDPIIFNDTTLGPRGGWKNEPTLDKCLINICALKCNVGGFLTGACIDEKVCHCYSPRGVRELRKIETNNIQPRVAIALPKKALLETSLVIDVPLCVSPKCRILCKSSLFRKGRCESNIKCRCSQKIVSPVHKNIIELRNLPKGINKTSLTTKISAEIYFAPASPALVLPLGIPPRMFPKITSLSPPLITLTRDPLLDMFIVINMEGCVQRKCRIKCNQSHFRKSHCEGNRCHCQEKIARTKNKKKRAMWGF